VQHKFFRGSSLTKYIIVYRRNFQSSDQTLAAVTLILSALPIKQTAKFKFSEVSSEGKYYATGFGFCFGKISVLF
jgi:hypothetical protein